MTAEVMTVLGPVKATELGPTLPHEHIYIDLLPMVDEFARHRPTPFLNEQVKFTNVGALRQNPYANRDNCILDDEEVAVRELERFIEAGGRTVVDVTNHDIGSSPARLRKLAERLSINIIAGCGYYVNFTHKENLAALTMEEIAETLISGITEGLEGTDVKPGIIGEVGTTHPIHPAEEKSLRAAARAYHETGLTISVHVHCPTRGGHEVLDILGDEDVPMNRVVLGHQDAALAHNDIEFPQAIEYHISLAKRGAFIEYDLCGNGGFFTDGSNSWWLPSDRERCKGIAALVEAGFTDSLLISQDVGHKHYLTEYGGWGYSHVLTDFKLMLESFNVDQTIHDAITRLNPARMLTGES